MDKLSKIQRYKRIKSNTEIAVAKELDRIDEDLNTLNKNDSILAEGISILSEDTSKVIKDLGDKLDNISSDLSNKIENVKTIKGEDGKDGYTPIKGKDYFDGKNGKDGKTIIVDKIIEKVETIKEVPIVTENVVEIIKEDVSGETIVERINSQKTLIKKEKIEGLDDIERKVDFAVNRPATVVGVGGGSSGIRSVTGDKNISVTNVNEKVFTSLNDNLVGIDNIQFDTTFEDGCNEGRLQWNSEDGTLEFGLPGGSVNLQIGQETLIRCKNVTGDTIPNGSVVYVSGASGQRPEISLANATDYDTSYVVGMATEDIATFGYVTLTGLVRDVNTDGMSEGLPIWLDTVDGQFTQNPPEAPNIKVFIGYVLYAHQTEGIVAIRPVLVPRLQGLSDVYANNLSYSGQVPIWDNDNQRFNFSSNVDIDSNSFRGSKILLAYRGDDTTYSTLETDGNGDLLFTPNVANKTLVLADTVWEDIQFQISSGRVAQANYPTWEAFTTNTSEYSFAVNDYIDLGANEMAHWWKEGTAISPHLHVTTKGANNSGSSQYAKFIIYFAYSDAGETWTETNVELEKEIPNGTSALTHFLVNGANIALTNNKIGTQVKIRVKRIPATTGTEYTGSIFVTQMGIHAEADTLGSRTIGTK